MGYLFNGQWTTDDVVPDGIEMQQFTKQITKEGEFKPESGRYHVYYSFACPWAARVLATRELKGLQSVISVSPVATEKHADGWVFEPHGQKSDPNNKFKFLREIYQQTDSKFTGRVSVPVLYDKQTKQIINTESEQIMRMLNKEFHELSKNKIDLFPVAKKQLIEAINPTVCAVNIGVYRCGFAKTQDEYNREVKTLFHNLDKLEETLSDSTYLTGDTITEPDVKLFATIVRFDNIYYNLFKTNLKKVADYPSLTRFFNHTKENTSLMDTVNMREIIDHYFKSDFPINENIVSIRDQ